MDKSSVDFLVLCHKKQDMKVSTKSVTSEYMCHIPINIKAVTEKCLTFLVAITTFFHKSL